MYSHEDFNKEMTGNMAPPTIQCPAVIWVDCQLGDTGVAVAFDDCLNSLPVTYTDSGSLDGCGLGTISRKWVAEDPAGNSTTCTQKITVKDDEPLQFDNCPTDQIVLCNAMIPAVTPVSASDNCDPDVEVIYEGEIRSGSCGSDFYTLTRSWTAVDNCSNTTSTCIQHIKVKTQLLDPCFTIELDMSYHEVSDETTFGWELCVGDGNCQDLGSIGFTLPCDLPKNSVVSTQASIRGIMADIGGKPSRPGSLNCNYELIFEGFRDGGIKDEADGCVRLEYTLRGDHQNYLTDVAIKAEKGKDLGFENVGATCDCDGSVMPGNNASPEWYSGQISSDIPQANSSIGIADFLLYPNPSGGATTFQFSLPKNARTSLDIFDLKGKRVLRVFNQTVTAGEEFTRTLDKGSLPAGTYLYRLVNGQTLRQGKFVIMN